MDNQRNIVIAVVLSLALLLGFDMVMGQLYPQPAPTERVTADADTPAQQVAIEGGAAAVAEQRRDLRTALAGDDPTAPRHSSSRSSAGSAKA